MVADGFMLDLVMSSLVSMAIRLVNMAMGLVSMAVRFVSMAMGLVSMAMGLVCMAMGLVCMAMGLVGLGMSRMSMLLGAETNSKASAKSEFLANVSTNDCTSEMGGSQSAETNSSEGTFLPNGAVCCSSFAFVAFFTFGHFSFWAHRCQISTFNSLNTLRQSKFFAIRRPLVPLQVNCLGDTQPTSKAKLLAEVSTRYSASNGRCTQGASSSEGDC